MLNAESAIVRKANIVLCSSSVHREMLFCSREVLVEKYFSKNMKNLLKCDITNGRIALLIL